MGLGKVFVKLLKNECPYMNALVISYVDFIYDFKGQM
jgi:hypothetical protein